MSKRSDLVEEEDLVFSNDDGKSYALMIPTHRLSCSAPARFVYYRVSAGVRSGAVHAWMPGGVHGWGDWKEIAFMPHSDEEQIELFMRNAARLGLDEGPLHVQNRPEAST